MSELEKYHKIVEQRRKACLAYRAKNHDQLNEYSRNYYHENREAILKKKSEYGKKKRMEAKAQAQSQTQSIAV